MAASSVDLSVIVPAYNEADRLPETLRRFQQYLSSKRIIGQVGNRIIQSVAVPGIWDTQCGFKAFRDYAAEKIFSVGFIEGWGFDIETLALARALHYKIGIVPAYWINKPGSHVGIFSYVQVLLDIARVRRGLSRGEYKLSK
jgi:dolichyl-phosphate beta-glucosyltransferase